MKQMGEDDEENVDIMLKELEAEIKKGRTEDIQFRVKEVQNSKEKVDQKSK